MEQTKNETRIEGNTGNTAMPDNKGKPKKERKPLTEAQRLQRQKMIVLPVMVLVFIGAIWLIFAPSSETEQEPGTGGYNTEMPDADKADRQIIGDKLKAYEQAAMEERLEERDHAVRQLGDMFDRETGDTGDGGGFDLSTPEGKEDGSATQTIRSSAAAYRDLNATLGNFYEEPARNDAEMEELMERISLLESELESEKEKGSTMDEQVALMEKSYELAAKYMGGQNGTQTAKPSSVQKAGKNKAEPVRQVERQVVSSLAQPAGNAEVAATCPQERNRGFNTAVGGTAISDKNTLSACVYGAQSVTDGQAVSLRLLEPMQVARYVLPTNTVVFGVAGIEGQRLSITVKSIESGGNIIPVQLTAHDTDGQPGLNIPTSLEHEAAKEAVASVGSSGISSISVTHNAGQQAAMDLVRGAMSAGSQYLNAKMREVKINLKAGYQLLLISKE